MYELVLNNDVVDKAPLANLKQAKISVPRGDRAAVLFFSDALWKVD